MKKDSKTRKYIFEYKMGIITILSLVLFIVPVIITGFLFDFELDISFSDSSSFFIKYFLFFIAVFLWMVLHEIIHGVFYQINGAKSENITYGVVLEKGIFFCKCGEFISRKNILMSVIAPFIIIGVITYIISIITNSFLLLVLSIFNISGAAGDLMVFFFFLKQKKDIRFKELGDSTTFCLETSDDLSNKKYWGVKLKEEVMDDTKINEINGKKINISKPSKYILIGFLIFMALFLIIGFFL